MKEKDVYDKWHDRWDGASEEEKLTLLGKKMFVAKKRVIRGVVEKLKPESVLEVGAGLGYTLEVFRDMGLNAEGIDISEGAVDFCRKKGLNTKVMRLEDVEEKYSLVSSDGMLEHFLNFEPYAEMMMNISSRYVMLIQPNYNSFTGQTLAYLANLVRGNVNVYEFNYRIEDFVKVFESHDFVLKESLPVFLNVFRLMVFEKREG